MIHNQITGSGLSLSAPGACFESMQDCIDEKTSSCVIGQRFQLRLELSSKLRDDRAELLNQTRNEALPAESFPDRTATHVRDDALTSLQIAREIGSENIIMDEWRARGNGKYTLQLFVEFVDIIVVGGAAESGKNR